MHPAFQRLRARVEPLGNPARKHLRAVEQHGERLVARLEAQRTLSQVHLDRAAPALAEDFECVAAAGRDPDEKLLLLGTFYATQHLHQNARALEQLAYSLTERTERRRAYATYLKRSEDEFSALVDTYVGHVLGVLLHTDARFSLLAVGTRGHQDDIDVAVIDLGGPERAELDRAMARLSSQCLRFASPLDNYIAGEAERDGFCISLDELQRALRSGRLGFVVVTELLRAEVLTGDDELLRRLRQVVMSEYFFRPGQNNSQHELYLRGLLGETRSLLLRPAPPDRVNPKDDGLRLILGLATAFKTIERVDATAPGDILPELASGKPRLSASLLQLDDSRIFLETFRQVAQMLVAQEEDIAVEGEPARENLARIAAAMGHRAWGPVGAVDRLLVNYYEAVEKARSAAVVLMEEVARHLTRISRFAGWASGTPPADFATVLGEALVTNARTFRGVRFYDDLLDALGAPGGRLLPLFVQSYGALPAAERAALADLYAEWGSDAPYALLTILTLLFADAGAAAPAGDIFAAYVARLPEKPEAVRALSRVFRFYPALTNRLLLALDARQLELLEQAVVVPIGDPEVAAARDRLRALISVQRRTSRYVKRVLARVTARYAATVDAVADDATLRTLALGRLAASERHPNPEEQKSLLGDFYDIEFLRIALGTLRGEPARRTRAAFADLTNAYLDRLFDLCFRQADREIGRMTPLRDRMGVFLSGGNARARPFDEDYDLIALIDAAGAEERSSAERVAALMNRQISRRGVIPQYRLSDHLGFFVVTIDELVELLSRDDDSLFVDRCQLLGCRMVVGGRRVEQQLEQRVLKPLVFQQADLFAERIAQEIAERRRTVHPLPKGLLDMKRAPGGLREIDLCLALAKARLAFWRPGETDPFGALARIDSARAPIYEGLSTANDFFVAVRTAYRVTVAATDQIERDHLDAPARILNDAGEPWTGEAGRHLFEDIEDALAAAAAHVDRILDRATWR